MINNRVATALPARMAGSIPQRADVTADRAAPRARVGVFTLHYALNYGAILQSLVTARLFQGEIIDHRYRSKWHIYAEGGKFRPHLAAFIDEQLPLSECRFWAPNFGNGPTLRFVANGRYDLLVYGSDELWKLHYRLGKSRRQIAASFWKHPVRTVRDYAWAQTSAGVTPFPNVYWPLTDVPSVGFAGSVGETMPEQIPPRHRAAMRECVRHYKALGVRDSRTAEFFEELCPEVGERIRRIPDPVFTFRARTQDQNEARHVLEANGIDTGRPFAFVHSMRRRERLVPIAKECGLKIVDLLALPLTPPQWFAAIGLAACGVTDAMHPFIASLVQNTPCLSLDPRFKSAELRREFGVDGYGTIDEVVANWPESVPAQAQEYAGRVHAFVHEARSHARCGSA